MPGLSETRKVTYGFIMSMIAGVLVLLNGVLWFVLFHITEMIFADDGVGMTILRLPFLILGSVGILFAIGIFAGASYIYFYGSNPAGGKVVVVFSALSITVGGGLLIGFILGIVGGTYGIKNK
jgi:hypothetical protein